MQKLPPVFLEQPMKQLLTFGLILIFWTSCATASLTEFSAAPSQNTFRNLLISVDTTDLGLKVRLENKVLQKMDKNFGALLSTWHDFFPPLKTYTDKELWQKIASQGIDSLLVFTLKGSESQTYATLMPTWVTAYGTTRGVINGNDVNTRTRTTVQVYTPYFYQTKTEKWEVSLMNARTKEKIWLAVLDVNSTQDAAGLSTLTSRISKELSKKGFFPSKN